MTAEQMANDLLRAADGDHDKAYSKAVAEGMGYAICRNRLGVRESRRIIRWMKKNEWKGRTKAPAEGGAR